MMCWVPTTVITSLFLGFSCWLFRLWCAGIKGLCCFPLPTCFSCWLFRLWCAGSYLWSWASSCRVSVAGCLGYDVLVRHPPGDAINRKVSVAGCLGYDVLVKPASQVNLLPCFSCWLFRLWCAGFQDSLVVPTSDVSVAGCLGYDVLVILLVVCLGLRSFSCWLFRLWCAG